MAKRPSSPATRSQRSWSPDDVTTARPNNAAALDDLTYTLGRRGRHWEVRDATGTLVCLTVYKRGAAEVIRRLSA